MVDPEVQSAVRIAISTLRSQARPPAGAELGALVMMGHSDVGPTGRTQLALSGISQADAEERLSQHEQTVISEFVEEVSKIRRGINEGGLIDDGGEQFVVARIFSRGSSDEMVPCSGLSIMCNPSKLHGIHEMDWSDAYWEDWFKV